MGVSRRDSLKASAAASALAGLRLPGETQAAQGERWTKSAGRVVAGVIIATKAGAAPRVAARLLREPGLELLGGDGDHRLAAVFTGPDGASLEAISERLVKGDEEILGLYPTFVGDEDA